jgi:hypothetical protein
VTSADRPHKRCAFHRRNALPATLGIHRFGRRRPIHRSGPATRFNPCNAHHHTMNAALDQLLERHGHAVSRVIALDHISRHVLDRAVSARQVIALLPKTYVRSELAADVAVRERGASVCRRACGAQSRQRIAPLGAAGPRRRANTRDCSRPRSTAWSPRHGRDSSSSHASQDRDARWIAGHVPGSQHRRHGFMRNRRPHAERSTRCCACAGGSWRRRTSGRLFAAFALGRLARHEGGVDVVEDDLAVDDDAGDVLA